MLKEVRGRECCSHYTPPPTSNLSAPSSSSRCSRLPREKFCGKQPEWAWEWEKKRLCQGRFMPSPQPSGQDPFPCPLGRGMYFVPTLLLSSR